jgi:transcriptional antiterminator RfaH
MAAGRTPDSEDRVGRWYVVHTRPNCEFRALAQLENQRFKSFLPYFQKTVRHARQFRSAKAALFPRYCFVQLDIDRDRWRSVNSTIGVSHLIMEGERPKPVPAGIVEELMAVADGTGLVSLGPRLRPGENVRLVTGPFAGLVGELLQLDDAGRVRVLLDVLGKRITVRASRVGLVPA